MATVLITGGTGFIGSHLSRFLREKGYHVIILSRKPGTASKDGIEYRHWNIESGEIDAGAIGSADHIIHLAGAGMADQRWTKSRKKEIIDSRAKSGELLADALQRIPNHVSTVVSTSAIGWYGPDTTETRVNGFTEDAPASTEFPAVTCKAWEQSVQPVTRLGKRLVIVRVGIVLSPDGGALKAFSKPLRFGIAPIFSKGDQVVSWISMEDLCRIFLYALEHPEIKGVYNGVAPQPVSNKELILQLAAKLRGKFFIPVHIPSFMLRLMLGELSVEVLKSATVSSNKIRQAGFTFIHPGIKAALDLK
ncbi:MAG TPA: TIGR01777 family oxidoreductase [Chitinophagaceae bacterium]